jgi:hypothetical protein
METIERVARALATAFNNDDDDAWERFVDEAQAAIDAMQPDIEEADRKAREECAGICERHADRLAGSTIFDRLIDGSAVARQCAKDIRSGILDTITPASRQDDAQSAD